jgi:hypothetical protein
MKIQKDTPGGAVRCRFYGLHMELYGLSFTGVNTGSLTAANSKAGGASE